MKMTIDAMFAKHIMRDYGRDYFTTTALEAIFDYYDEIDGGNTEFDPIAICCDWNEYGDGAALSFSDFVNDYSYLMDGDEDFNDLDDDDKIDTLINEIDARTYIMQLENGNILLAVF